MEEPLGEPRRTKLPQPCRHRRRVTDGHDELSREPSSRRPRSTPSPLGEPSHSCLCPNLLAVRRRGRSSERRWTSKPRPFYLPVTPAFVLRANPCKS